MRTTHIKNPLDLKSTFCGLETYQKMLEPRVTVNQAGRMDLEHVCLNCQAQYRQNVRDAAAPPLATPPEPEEQFDLAKSYLRFNNGAAAVFCVACLIIDDYPIDDGVDGMFTAQDRLYQQAVTIMRGDALCVMHFREERQKLLAKNVDKKGEPL